MYNKFKIWRKITNSKTNENNILDHKFEENERKKLNIYANIFKTKF